MHMVKHFNELQKMQKQLKYEAILNKTFVMSDDLIGATYCDLVIKEIVE